MKNPNKKKNIIEKCQTKYKWYICWILLMTIEEVRRFFDSVKCKLAGIFYTLNKLHPNESSFVCTCFSIVEYKI